jgi:hypothetical protein
VLPAWDGITTPALAGSKSGFGRRKSGDLVPIKGLIANPKPALEEPTSTWQKLTAESSL